MATIQLKDDATYGKAITVLLEIGGIFQTRHPRKLLIGPAQIQALRNAGLLPKAKEARKNGKKQS